MPPASISPSRQPSRSTAIRIRGCLCHRSGACLIKKYPGFFLFHTSTTNYAKGAIDVLKNLKDGSQIGNKVAVVNVADDFGIELANAGRPMFKEAGFEIVYDKSYPLGTQDLLADRQSRQGGQSGCLRRLVLSARYIRPRRASQDRRRSTSKPITAPWERTSRASAKNSAAQPRTSSAPAASRTPRKSAPSTRGIRKSPASMPTTGAASSNYQTLQALTQAIEAVGSIDRDAIADYVRNQQVHDYRRRDLATRPDYQQGLHCRPVAERFLPRRERSGPHGFCAGQVEDQLELRSLTHG